MAETLKKQLQLAYKLPPKQKTLTTALEAVVEEQEWSKTMIADLKLEGKKNQQTLQYTGSHWLQLLSQCLSAPFRRDPRMCRLYIQSQDIVYQGG